MAEPAEHFDNMAERIRKNAGDEFSGALLVVPPGDAATIEILLIDPRQDIAHFWAMVAAKVQVAAAEFAEQGRNQDPWRR